MFFDVCVIILRNEAKCIKTYTGSGRIEEELERHSQESMSELVHTGIHAINCLISNIEQKNGVENNDNMF